MSGATGMSQCLNVFFRHYLTPQILQLVTESLFFIYEGQLMNMWQSHVEIEGYSVTYFDRIVAFEAPYR